MRVYVGVRVFQCVCVLEREVRIKKGSDIECGSVCVYVREREREWRDKDRCMAESFFI